MEAETKIIPNKFEEMDDVRKVLYRSIFVQYIGGSVNTEGSSVDVEKCLCLFTVPKSSTITLDDIEKDWGKECLDFLGFSDEDDWTTPIGIAKVVKKVLKEGVLEDTKSVAKQRLGNDELIDEFMADFESSLKFMYTVRDEEWSSERGLSVVKETIDRINQYASYQEI